MFRVENTYSAYDFGNTEVGGIAFMNEVGTNSALQILYNGL